MHDFTPLTGQIVAAAESEPGQGCKNPRFLANNGSSNSDKFVPLGQQPAGRYYVWVINDGLQSADAIYRLFIRAVPPA